MSNIKQILGHTVIKETVNLHSECFIVKSTFFAYDVVNQSPKLKCDQVLQIPGSPKFEGNKSLSAGGHLLLTAQSSK